MSPEQKDFILIQMVNDGERDWLTVGPKYFNTNEAISLALIRQFSRRGFIIDRGGGKVSANHTVTVEMDADDFLARGGYQFEEEIFQNNFIKLQIELKKLEEENPTINFENATKLVSAVGAGFSIYRDILGG